MRSLAVTILLCLCGCDLAQPRASDSPAAMRPVERTALPAGRLGPPLGTYLQIEGVRLESGKVGTRTLLVDTVDGRQLVEPIGVWIENVPDPGLPAGVRCVLRGYESGEMIGIPDAVLEAENLPAPQAAWQFRRYFVMTSAVEPGSLRQE